MENFETTCLHCGDKQTILTGESMAVGSNTIPPKIWTLPEGHDEQSIIKLFDSGEVVDYTRPYKLLCCPQCDTVSSNACFIAKDKAGNILFETKHYCDQCQTLLKSTPRSLSSFCCQQCGNRALIAKPIQLCVD